MATAETVIILGAGASIPYGYPSGSELLKRIARFPDEQTFGIYHECVSFPLRDWKKFKPENQQYYQSLVKFCDHVKEYVEAQKDNKTASIDRFLFDHPEHFLNGTHMIAYLIMNCAKFAAGSFPSDRGWYEWLWSAILLYKENLSEKLAVITYNYDVSAEAFISTKLTRLGTTKRNAKSLFEALEIIHVYGKVAETTFQQLNDYFNVFNWGGYDFENLRRGYGEHLRESIVWSRASNPAKQLRTIYSQKFEEVYKAPHMLRARELIENAKRIAFIGFGFEELNVRLLGKPSASEIYCTNYENDLRITQAVSTWSGIPRNKIIFESDGLSLSQMLTL